MSQKAQIWIILTGYLELVINDNSIDKKMIKLIVESMTSANLQNKIIQLKKKLANIKLLSNFDYNICRLFPQAFLLKQ